ncbi:MAG: hypothetical protein HIU90_07420 [Proteobacteria bacterium]|nr:hypothetical protein [Pseudomonadota bacterium]
MSARVIWDAAGADNQALRENLGRLEVFSDLYRTWCDVVGSAEIKVDYDGGVFLEAVRRLATAIDQVIEIRDDLDLTVATAPGHAEHRPYRPIAAAVAELVQAMADLANLLIAAVAMSLLPLSKLDAAACAVETGIAVPRGLTVVRA